MMALPTTSLSTGSRAGKAARPSQQEAVSRANCFMLTLFRRSMSRRTLLVYNNGTQQAAAGLTKSALCPEARFGAGAEAGEVGAVFDDNQAGDQDGKGQQRPLGAEDGPARREADAEIGQHEGQRTDDR